MTWFLAGLDGDTLIECHVLDGTPQKMVRKWSKMTVFRVFFEPCFWVVSDIKSEGAFYVTGVFLTVF